MKVLLISSLFFLFTINLCYSSQPDLEISILELNKLKIKENKSERIYKFNVSINGYEVNCSGEKMVLWGYPLKFNDQSPADNGYVIFDLKDKKTIKKSNEPWDLWCCIFV
ncbi:MULTISPECIES: hypothetical protein [unclassified Serratia (in: enterobacteria)]|uniref:hypothetical protein n=1 Tax=unclassified Serratia (in: enterobacteria) TaxID=2647522 RepID=UPI0030760E2C